MTWKFGDRDIITTNVENITAPEYEDRITIFTSTASLELRNLAPNDSGEYRVTIIPQGETQREGTTRLDVHASSLHLWQGCSVGLHYELTDGAGNRVETAEGQITLGEDQTEQYTMFLRSIILVFLSSVGLCYGAGVVTVDSLRGAAGESVTFTTSVKPASKPYLALTWSFNGTINVITSTSVDVVGQGYENRITLDKSTGSLVLRNLTEKDSGEYELIIIPHGAEQIQGTAKLEVLTKVARPTIACPTENLIEGKTSVNLTCDADGFVSTRVWMKDGQPLVSGDRFSFHDGNRVLSISPVNRTDTGEFLCNVSNDFSFDTAKCRLKVYYGPDKPIIVQRPIGAELEESVTLSCSADSLPKATFFWTFKHMMMHGSLHYIHEMQQMHLGRYTCTARNRITGLEASVVHTLRGI